VKISFHAALPPSMQLKSFEDRHEIDQAHLSSTPSPPPPQRPLDAPPPIPPMRDFSERRESTNDSGFLSPEKSAGPYQSPPNQPPPPVPARQFSLSKTSLSNGDHEKVIQHRNDGLMDKSDSDDTIRPSPPRSATLPVGSAPPRPPPAGPNSARATGSLRRQQTDEDRDFVAWMEAHGTGGQTTASTVSSTSHDLDTSSLTTDDDKKKEKEKRSSFLGSIFKSSKTRRDSKEFKD